MTDTQNVKRIMEQLPHDELKVLDDWLQQMPEFLHKYDGTLKAIKDVVMTERLLRDGENPTEGVEYRAHITPEGAMAVSAKVHGPAPAPDPIPQAELAAKRRDLNARGKGIEEYRLLGSLDGDTLVWADQHSCAMVTRSDWGPRGYRASERRCSMDIAADAGLLVVEIEKSIGSRGRSAPTYRAGVTDPIELDGVRWETQDGCPVKHVGIKKQNGGFVHVLEVDGVRREYTSG